MRSGLAILLFALAAAQAQTATPPFARSKERTMSLLAHTPDYVCLETIARVVRDRGQENVAEVVRVEVGVANGKEICGWQRGKHFSGRTLPELARTGLTATGRYGPFAQGLLGAGDAYFQAAGAEKIYGEPAFRYDFAIPRKDAGWALN